MPTPNATANWTFSTLCFICAQSYEVEKKTEKVKREKKEEGGSSKTRRGQGKKKFFKNSALEERAGESDSDGP